MYKILFLLKKPIDEKILNHFKETTMKTLSEISGNEVFFAEVESNLLAENKFSYLCEAKFNSKNDMDKMMNSKAGLDLNKDLMSYHQYLTIITANDKL